MVPANASVQLPTTYTLALVDAGPVGTDQSAGQTRHWLVNGATTEADGGVSFFLRSRIHVFGRMTLPFAERIDLPGCVHYKLRWTCASTR